MQIMVKYNYSYRERGIILKKIYMDFEMNMPSSKGKRESFKAEIIAIGAIKYDTKTGKIDKQCCEKNRKIEIWINGSTDFCFW